MAEPRKILTLNAISAQRAGSACPEHYTVGGDVVDPDGILVRSANMHEMDIPASVQAIARAGAGTNNIPVKKLSERGVPVFNAPGANANAVKELVIAGMLLAARNLVPAISFVEGLAGSDEEMHKATEAGKKAFAGTELPGRTLGVIGLGAIGSYVAEAAIKLGMNVRRLRPRDHRRCRMAPAVAGQARRERRGRACASPISSPCTCRWSTPPATSSMPSASVRCVPARCC